MLTTVANDAASTQQHVASAPLKRLANGLRCADAMRFDAVKIEVALPSWLLRLDAAKEKGKRKEHASLSSLPRGARCHQLLSDRGLWRCGDVHAMRRAEDFGYKHEEQSDRERVLESPHLKCNPSSLGAPDWSLLHSLSKAYGVYSRSAYSYSPAAYKTLRKSAAALRGRPYYRTVLLISGAWDGGPLDQRPSRDELLRRRAHGAAPLAFYLAALEALRVPGHNASEPFLVLTPSYERTR